MRTTPAATEDAVEEQRGSDEGKNVPSVDH